MGKLGIAMGLGYPYFKIGLISAAFGGIINTILIFTVLFTLGLNVFTIMLATVIGSTFTVGLFSIFLFRSYTQELSKKINLAALTSYTGHGN